MTYTDAKELLTQKDQLQLLDFYDELNEEEKTSLLQDIASIDWSLLDVLKDPDSITASRGTITPLGAVTVEDIDANRVLYEEAGLNAIRLGKTAAVLMAGGQGTRLGFDKPKGTFNIGLTKDLYIFECLINNLTAVTDAAGVKIPLYIMTSAKNNADTIAFFKEHDYFGYGEENVKFFEQSMAPSVSYEGKLLMEDKHKLSLSPNGNGGWYLSLERAGYTKELLDKGIEYLSVFNVDNVLQKINDPVFVGAAVLSGSDVSAKVVRKKEPHERLGVMCLDDGKPSIIEYYEMTEDMVNLTDENGNLLYAFGSISNFLFRLSKLEEIVHQALPVHIVEKKIPYINEKGTLVKPESPNGFKFEFLILDMVTMMDSCLPFEVVRDKEFAPVKNAVGTDSAETARALLKENGISI